MRLFHSLNSSSGNIPSRGYISCGILAIVSLLSILIVSPEITEAKTYGIVPELTLISNTNKCGGDIPCETVYEVCDPTISLVDFTVEFMNERKQDIGNLIRNKDLQIQVVNPPCKQFTIRGEKSPYTNIDNIPCVKDVCDTRFTWWNATFPYRKPINITVSDGSTLTDFQLEMMLELENGMQDDFDDARFLNNCSEYAVELDYLLEHTFEFAPSIIIGNFWVDIDVINTTICLYWGNPDVGSQSNGSMALPIFFDDIENYANDTLLTGQGGWTGDTNKVAYIFSDGLAFQGDKYVFSNRTVGADLILDNSIGDYENITIVGYMRANATDKKVIFRIVDSEANGFGETDILDSGKWYYRDGAGLINTNINYSADTWYRSKLYFTQSTYDIDVRKADDFSSIFTVDDASLSAYSDGVDKIRLVAGISPPTEDGASFDLIFAAKYHDPYPEYSPRPIEEVNITVVINVTEYCPPETIRICEPFDQWTSQECIDANTLQMVKNCTIEWVDNSTNYICSWVKTEDINCPYGCDSVDKICKVDPYIESGLAMLMVFVVFLLARWVWVRKQRRFPRR